MIHRDKYWSQAQEAATYLTDHGVSDVDVVLQCGSGLSMLGDLLGDDRVAVPMGSIPNLPSAEVFGHGKDVVFGQLGKTRLAIFTGRLHLYEGHDPLTAGFPAAIAKALGAKLLMVTNAAGGLNQHFLEGDTMVHRDFINFQHDNAIAHLAADTSQERFIDPKPSYHPKASELTARCLIKAGLGVHFGVYIGVRGPLFETRAELAMMRSFGADAIGMSTVPEVTVAAFFNLPVVGVSTITNECFAAGTSHEEVLTVSNAVAPKLASGLTLFLEEGQWGDAI